MLRRLLACVKVLQCNRVKAGIQTEKDVDAEGAKSEGSFLFDEGPQRENRDMDGVVHYNNICRSRDFTFNTICIHIL